MPAWRVRLTQTARRDLAGAVSDSARNFGRAQAERYRSILLAAIRELENGPNHLLARRRDDLPGAPFFLHAARRGSPARHIIAYHVISDGRIEVVSILHDAMDLPAHLGLHEDAALFHPGP